MGRRRLIWNTCEMDGMLVFGEHAHLRVEATSSDDWVGRLEGITLWRDMISSAGGVSTRTRKHAAMDRLRRKYRI